MRNRIKFGTPVLAASAVMLLGCSPVPDRQLFEVTPQGEIVMQIGRRDSSGVNAGTENLYGPIDAGGGGVETRPGYFDSLHNLAVHAETCRQTYLPCKGANSDMLVGPPVRSACNQPELRDL